METNRIFARNAYLPQGWARDVSISWNEQGDITEIQVNQDDPEKSGRTVIEWLLPGMCNLHSHAFQRAMAGMTEIAGPGKDSFWTWRDLMYRLALQIAPEQIQAIAAQLYSECLRMGYTAVCEFHYLHRDPQGLWYGDRAEMSRRIIAAAHQTGIGITHLPVLYSYSDFAEKPLREDQRRFNTQVDDILKIVDLLECERSKQVEVGVAPHSLRASTVQQIQTISDVLPIRRPLHIHIAEQIKEVEACETVHNQRPVQRMREHGLLGERWCYVHATHLSRDEVTAIAQSGTVAGICTTTEANLGDGFFELPEFLEQEGSFGIGSDSHVSQSPVEELRWLEYGQRLRLQGRNISATANNHFVGDHLWKSALAGGARASGRLIGQLSVGYRADFIALDGQHPNLQELNSKHLLNTWIFAGNDNLVRDVWVGGKHVVVAGKHIQQDQIAKAWRETMRALT